jgi:hypothetical protein
MACLFSPLRRGRYLHRRCFETTPGSFNFRLGCGLASRPRLGGGRGVFSDVISNDRARSALNESGVLAGFRLRSWPQANRSDAYPARPMTVFDFEVITWHRHLQMSQCLIPASVPPAMIVDGNVKSPRVSNIDHRAVMPNRHITAITARSSAPVGDREGLAALWPDPTGGIVARSANTHPIAARGGAASLSQMPVAHGGPAHYRSSYRFRALDTEMHQMRPYP